MPAQTSSPRRIGTTNSETRARLVAAAAELLLDEGYAAVTSRKVAAKADLKPQLVHYYFRSMDDLYLEVFRQSADANLARFEREIAKDGSLRTLWRLNADARGAAFTIEFAALANHHKTIRKEIAAYAERFRAAQLEALTRALAADGVSISDIPPTVALVLMTGVTQVIAIEEALGVTSGHKETIAFIEQAVTLIEPREPGGPPTA